MSDAEFELLMALADLAGKLTLDIPPSPKLTQFSRARTAVMTLAIRARAERESGVPHD